jgi:hypothetical protein
MTRVGRAAANKGYYGSGCNLPDSKSQAADLAVTPATAEHQRRTEAAALSRVHWVRPEMNGTIGAQARHLAYPCRRARHR